MNEAALQGLALAGTFLSASIWWVRASLAQQNRITDRFISSLEKLIAEKKEEARLNRVALARLTGAVRRNSAIVSQLNPPPKLGIQNPPPKIGVQDPPPKIGLQDPPPKIGRG